ncbi:MAG: thioesterase family protein [Myxococcota bacterium]
MNRFDRDTAVRPLGDGRFQATIDRGWWITHGPNGGYLAALLIKALETRLGDPERCARSLSLHYLSPPTEGPCEITVAIERSGRSLTSLSARLLQGEKTRVLALAAFATARPGTGWEVARCEVPSVPPPNAIPEERPEVTHLAAFRERVETLFVPGFEPFGRREDPDVRAWMRLREPRALDAAAVALYADALPPAVFALREGERPVGAPTIELTIHFYGDPATAGVADDDYCLARVVTHTTRDGFLSEDGWIFSRDGRLLCQSRQLAAIVEPTPSS